MPQWVVRSDLYIESTKATKRSRVESQIPVDPTVDPLQIWKKAQKICPYLAKVARDVLAVPATSAAPERKFSVAGDMNRQKRGRLTCANIEELVFLNQALPVLKKMRAEKEVKGVSMEGSSKD